MSALPEDVISDELKIVWDGIFKEIKRRKASGGKGKFFVQSLTWKELGGEAIGYELVHGEDVVRFVPDLIFGDRDVLKAVSEEFMAALTAALGGTCQ